MCDCRYYCCATKGAGGGADAGACKVSAEDGVTVIGGATQETPCAPGKYSGTKQAVQCQACSANFFQPLPRSSECFACVDNAESGPGAKFCSCKEGYFKVVALQTLQLQGGSSNGEEDDQYYYSDLALSFYSPTA